MKVILLCIKYPFIFWPLLLEMLCFLYICIFFFSFSHNNVLKLQLEVGRGDFSPSKSHLNALLVIRYMCTLLFSFTSNCNIKFRREWNQDYHSTILPVLQTMLIFQLQLQRKYQFFNFKSLNYVILLFCIMKVSNFIPNLYRKSGKIVHGCMMLYALSTFYFLAEKLIVIIQITVIFFSIYVR